MGDSFILANSLPDGNREKNEIFYSKDCQKRKMLHLRDKK